MVVVDLIISILLYNSCYFSGVVDIKYLYKLTLCLNVLFYTLIN